MGTAIEDNSDEEDEVTTVLVLLERLLRKTIMTKRLKLKLQ